MRPITREGLATQTKLFLVDTFLKLVKEYIPAGPDLISHTLSVLLCRIYGKNEGKVMLIE